MYGVSGHQWYQNKEAHSLLQSMKLQENTHEDKGKWGNPSQYFCTVILVTLAKTNMKLISEPNFKYGNKKFDSGSR